MTFILTYADHNMVVQLSDRRFTYPDRLPFDMANKATLVCDRCTVSFTGHANAGSTGNHPPMDEWIAEVLPKHRPRDMGETCTALKVEAEKLFSTVHLPRRQKRIIFVVSGWAFLDSSPNAQPYVAIVSNAFAGGNWQKIAADEFTIRNALAVPRDSPFTLVPFGAYPEKYWYTMRLLRKGRVMGLSYTFLVKRMAEVARWTAANNPAIGLGQHCFRAATKSRPTYHVHG